MIGDVGGFVLYDRHSRRYVGAGGELTAHVADAMVFELPLISLRLVNRHSCEPLSLVAVRVEPPLALETVMPAAATA